MCGACRWLSYGEGVRVRVIGLGLESGSESELGLGPHTPRSQGARAQQLPRLSKLFGSVRGLTRAQQVQAGGWVVVTGITNGRASLSMTQGAKEEHTWPSAIVRWTVYRCRRRGNLRTNGCSVARCLYSWLPSPHPVTLTSLRFAAALGCAAGGTQLLTAVAALGDVKNVAVASEKKLCAFSTLLKRPGRAGAANRIPAQARDALFLASLVSSSPTLMPTLFSSSAKIRFAKIRCAPVPGCVVVTFIRSKVSRV